MVFCDLLKFYHTLSGSLCLDDGYSMVEYRYRLVRNGESLDSGFVLI